MAPTFPISGLRLYSLITKAGELEVSLANADVLASGANDVIVRIEASPINPFDLGLLFAPADMSTAHETGTIENPVVSASVPEAALTDPLRDGNRDPAVSKTAVQPLRIPGASEDGCCSTSSAGSARGKRRS